MATRRSSITACVATLVAVSSLACKSKGTRAAPSATAAPPPAPSAHRVTARTLKLGETASATDYQLTVLALKDCRSRYFFSETTKSHVWLGVEVTIQSASSATLYANPGSGKIIDDNGVAYKATFQVTKDCNPALGDVKLAKGEKATGWIVFDVPKEAQNLKFLYGDAETVKFELTR
jgi:Domain of unknown function (DUF4352)